MLHQPACACTLMFAPAAALVLGLKALHQVFSKLTAVGPITCTLPPAIPHAARPATPQVRRVGLREPRPAQPPWHRHPAPLVRFGLAASGAAATVGQTGSHKGPCPCCAQGAGALRRRRVAVGGFGALPHRLRSTCGPRGMRRRCVRRASWGDGGRGSEHFECQGWSGGLPGFCAACAIRYGGVAGARRGEPRVRDPGQPQPQH